MNDEDLLGRTFLVTGGTSGIGLAAARELARRRATVVIASRSKERLQRAAEEIRAATSNDAVAPIELDLASLASVRAATASFERLGLPLHVLVNNAGVAGVRGRTKDGFELAFGTNHLGHFLLTSLLLEHLRTSAPSRVVTVASASHFQAKRLDFTALRQRTRSLTGYPEYAISKLCNVLFAQELGRREAGRAVSSFSLHPGVVATGIWSRVPWPVRHLMLRSMLSPEEGAKTVLYCATEPGIETESGAYFDDCSVRSPSPLVTPQLAAQLWERSTAFVGLGH